MSAALQSPRGARPGSEPSRISVVLVELLDLVAQALWCSAVVAWYMWFWC